MQTQHTVAPEDSTFQFCYAAMSRCAFDRKKRNCLTFPPISPKTYGCGLAQLIIKGYFFGGRVQGLQFFIAPLETHVKSNMSNFQFQYLKILTCQTRIPSIFCILNYLCRSD